MSEHLNNTPLPELRRPVIIIQDDVWTYKSANVILISSKETDKRYMIEQQKTWDETNKDV